MHSNSLEAYTQGIKGSFKSRSQQVFECYYFGHKSLTDRQCLQMLYPGSDNTNLVQPRITGLIKDGILMECGTKVEAMRKVRVCKVREVNYRQREQQESFFN